MTTLLSIEDYEARLGRTLSGIKRSQAEAFIADASDEIRRIAQGHLDEIGPDEVSGTVRLVLFSMVTRARSNPTGLSSETIGDYSYSGARPVYVTEDERHAIEDEAGIQRVRTIQLTGDMPQRLLDEADAYPYTTYLGGPR